jgi:hypothetical protein
LRQAGRAGEAPEAGRRRLIGRSSAATPY